MADNDGDSCWTSFKDPLSSNEFVYIQCLTCTVLTCICPKSVTRKYLYFYSSTKRGRCLCTKTWYVTNTTASEPFFLGKLWWLSICELTVLSKHLFVHFTANSHGTNKKMQTALTHSDTSASPQFWLLIRVQVWLWRKHYTLWLNPCHISSNTIHLDARSPLPVNLTQTAVVGGVTQIQNFSIGGGRVDGLPAPSNLLNFLIVGKPW